MSVPMKDVIDIRWVKQLEASDPVARAALYTNRVRQHQEAVRFLAMLRNKALTEAHAQGYPITRLAERTGLSRQQVHRIIDQPFELATIEDEVFELLGVQRREVEAAVRAAQDEGLL